MNTCYIYTCIHTYIPRYRQTAGRTDRRVRKKAHRWPNRPTPPPPPSQKPARGGRAQVDALPRTDRQAIREEACRHVCLYGVIPMPYASSHILHILSSRKGPDYSRCVKHTVLTKPACRAPGPTLAKLCISKKPADSPGPNAPDEVLRSWQGVSCSGSRVRRCCRAGQRGRSWQGAPASLARSHCNCLRFRVIEL